MNKQLSLVFVFCFLISCGTLSSKKKTEKKSQLIYNLALASLRQCQYRQALKQLQEALKEGGKSQPVIYRALALVYFQLRQYPSAVNYFQKALQLEPEWTEARVDLGRSLVETGKVEQALNILKKAAKDLSYPYPENIHAHLGLAFFKKKNFKEAEMHFEVARKIQTRDCELALYHAQSLYFLKQYDQAALVLEPSKKWCQKAFLPPCASHILKLIFGRLWCMINREKTRKLLRI